MPVPFRPMGGGNVDFGMLEGISALQRNPQIQRVFGTGTLTFTGSVLYAVIPNSGTVSITDTTLSYQVAAPGLVFPFGAPLDAYQFTTPPGGSVTVTPSNLSQVFVTVLYK